MRFYIIMISVNPGLTIADVQAALANQYWYRIANNVWVIQTNLGTNGIFHQLSPLSHPSGNLFISHLDPTDRHGWMGQEFWTWVAQRIPYGV